MVRYKPYEKYKDSGVEWIGQIPEHWEMSRLKRVTELVIQKASNDDLDKPYIGLENIESWTGQYNTVEEFEDTSANLFSPGMVLFGKLRPYLAKSIKVNFWGRCSSELLTLDLKKIASCFLHYLLLTKGFISEVNSSTYGVKMPRAGWEFIGNMFMVIPPESEQQAIANFLDQKTSELDGLIADKEKLVTLLQEYRQAIISEAVTKGLNPDVKMKDSGVEWIGEIPEHWEALRAKFVLSKYKEIVGDRLDDYEVLSLTMNGVVKRDTSSNDGLLPESFETYQIIRPNDLVFKLIDLENIKTSRVGLSLYDGISSSAYIVLKNNKNETNRFYYYFYLMMYYKNVFNGLGQGVRSSLNAGALLKNIILSPSKNEQQAIADYLDRKTTEVDDLISGIRGSIAQLKLYRQSLISEAVTGKIDVRGVI